MPSRRLSKALASLGGLYTEVDRGASRVPRSSPRSLSRNWAHRARSRMITCLFATLNSRRVPKRQTLWVCAGGPKKALCRKSTMWGSMCRPDAFPTGMLHTCALGARIRAIFYVAGSEFCKEADLGRPAPIRLISARRKHRRPRETWSSLSSASFGWRTSGRPGRVLCGGAGFCAPGPLRLPSFAQPGVV